jgi:hypothetical protein
MRGQNKARSDNSNGIKGFLLRVGFSLIIGIDSGLIIKGMLMGIKDPDVVVGVEY